MSTIVSTMSSSVSLPRYISASSSLKKDHAHADHNGGQAGGGGGGTTLTNHTDWGSNLAQAAAGGGGDPLDFDLLAEYLLDDGAGPGGMDISFDFNVETPPLNPSDQSPGIVSPDQQAETSFADPLADATEQLASSSAAGPTGDIAGDLAHVQQMIATQAAAMTTAPPKAKAKAPPPPAAAAAAAPPRAGPYAHAGAPASHRGAHHPGASAAAAAADSNKRRRVDVSAPVTVGAMASNGVPSYAPQKGSGRQKTQAQIDRRRERNRILARRTRLRKKFFFESLQKDVTDLQRENALLKDIVRNRLSPDVAKDILDGCKANEEMPSVVAEQGTGLDKRDHNFIQSVQKSQQCFVITDPSLQDNPIVYVSDDFLQLTGYAREEVLGRNCRFLQGTETSSAKIAQVRKALENGDDCNVTMINYTADGTAFWNNLFIAALRDAENNIVNFIGVIVKVASPEPSDPEAGKKLPGESSPIGVDADELNHILGAGLDTADAAAKAAEGTLMGLEGAVSAAVAAAPNVSK